MTDPISNALERLFKLSENKTTIRIELAAGVTRAGAPA
jgi:xanthine/uracil/vitamin C permease (AzgA family)